MIIIGIDPGYERLGVAILEKKNQKETLLYSDCFKTPKELDFTKRLDLLSKEVLGLIDKFKPNTLAIENLFFNKNQKTVMKVSEVRGAIMNIALSKNLRIEEFTPLQIKIAITGYGRSDKNQIISMVKHLIKIEKETIQDDEFDAIAVALTCFASQKMRDTLN
jgi:crossover junction endodeoxyribonuclease RuvC